MIEMFESKIKEVLVSEFNYSEDDADKFSYFQ